MTHVKVILLLGLSEVAEEILVLQDQSLGVPGDFDGLIHFDKPFQDVFLSLSMLLGKNLAAHLVQLRVKLIVLWRTFGVVFSPLLLPGVLILEHHLTDGQVQDEEVAENN